MFAAVLRDYSQRLECLSVAPFDLHHAFFLPSSELESTLPPSQWEWPRLKDLDLRGFLKPSDSGPDQLPKTSADILVAAGRATTAMPALEIAYFKVEPKHNFFAKRELSKVSGSFKGGFVCISGFEESEEQRILTAWAPFIGGEIRLAEEDAVRIPPVRIYEAVTK